MSIGEEIGGNPPPIQWGVTYDAVVNAAIDGYQPAIDGMLETLDAATDINDVTAGSLWNTDRVSVDMLDALTEPLTEAATAAVEHYDEILDVAFDMDEAISRIAGGLENRTKWVGNDAWNAISRNVDLASREGWTLDQLAQTIRKDVLEPAGATIPEAGVDTARGWAQRLGKDRIVYRKGGLWVQRIAQTELGRVNALAQLEAAKAAGLRWKQWSTVVDDRTRHEAENDQIRYIDEPFSARGHDIDVPRGDGPASEVIGCRCVAVWDVSEEDAEAAGRP